MRKSGLVKVVLVAATIALSSMTVLATEDKEPVQIEAVVQENEVEQEMVVEEVEEVKQEQSKGEQVIEYAKQFIGTPYVYGGNSLTKGVDCSGFTSQVFKNFDISLNRRSADQYTSNGTKVSKADLQPGDLVFYGYSSVTHVAIYAGDNQIIHASTTHGIKIDPLSLRGMPPIIGYKRVI